MLLDQCCSKCGHLFADAGYPHILAVVDDEAAKKTKNAPFIDLYIVGGSITTGRK
jgi:hypothetical protein